MPECDTPRTDGAVMIVECEGRRVGAVHADLARDLEREAVEAVEAERERIRNTLKAMRDEPDEFEPDDDSDWGYLRGLRAALSVIDEGKEA